MIKTINEVKEGDFKIYDEITINFAQKLFFVGVEFAGEIYPCQASFKDVFAGDTLEQKEAFANKIKKAERIAVNNGVDPDTPIADEDIEVEI